MTLPSEQLAALRGLRDATTDAGQCAALDAAIAALEAISPPPTQVITGHTQVGVAVAGSIHGNVYLDGRRADEDARRLAAYLLRLRGSCGTLPLEGMRQQSKVDDVLRMGLDQVYTQLTVEGTVKREELRGAELRRLDLAAFLATHTGDGVLPWQHRVYLQRPLTPAERKERTRSMRELMTPDIASTPEERKRARQGTELALTADDLRIPTSINEQLKGLDADTLKKQRAKIEWLEFFGPRLVTDAIADTSHLVLLGEPGSGKSTALRYLTLMLAAAGLEDSVDLTAHLAGWDRLDGTGKLLPIFQPLLPFARRLAADVTMSGSADELWAYIVDQLEPGGTHTGLAAAVHAELSAGRALLLLDGLDEVAGAESRRKVVRAVDQFTTQYPQCRIVVSCRVRAYEGEQNRAWQLPGWPTATLAPWDTAQQQFFIAAWYDAAVTTGSLPASQRDSRVHALQRAVAVSPDLQRLADRPLLLTIMALVHLNDGRLPEDRVTLYSRCLDILLAQWETRGKEGSAYGALMSYIGLPERDVQRLRPLLSQLASTAHQAGSADSPGSLGRDTLRLLTADYLATLDHPNALQGAQLFLEYTDLRAGLLQSSAAGDAYVFPHLTFQEYLAGLELVRGVDFVDRIMARRADDRWRVPILLGLGHTVSEGLLSAPYQVLNRLLRARDRDVPRRQRDLLLAAEIGEDIGWDRLECGGDEFVALREELARELALVVEGMALPASERVRAGVQLGRVGDPRSGVCTLPPSMTRIESGSFVIGSTSDELVQAMDLFERTYDQPNKDSMRNIYSGIFQLELNDQIVEVGTLEIGRYLLTNAQFKLFIDNDGYAFNQPWWDDAGRAWLARDDRETDGLQSNQRRQFKGWPEYWEDERLGIARPNQPVVGVSWYEATAFCRWLSQHPFYNPNRHIYVLPSEAEWEYAASSNRRRLYPWGVDEPDGERANFKRLYDGTTTVGCFALGATPSGVLDMAGNVWEWTRSVYEPYPYYPDDGREAPEESAGKLFVLRGGGWFNLSFDLRAPYRGYFAPDIQDIDVGFRLARRLEL